MAEKYTFSVEDSLVDIIGFCKKIGITFWHTATKLNMVTKNSEDILTFRQRENTKDDSCQRKGKFDATINGDITLTHTDNNEQRIGGQLAFSIVPQPKEIVGKQKETEGMSGEREDITTNQSVANSGNSNQTLQMGIGIADTPIEDKGGNKLAGQSVADGVSPNPTLQVESSNANMSKGGEYVNQLVDPTHQYVNYFLYFVLASLLFLSYYKAFSFNRENNIQESFLETLVSTNSYLASTSILDKLRANFLFIFLALLLISLISLCTAALITWLTKIKFDRENCKATFYKVQRFLYYTTGTILIVELMPMFLRVIEMLTNSELDKDLENYFGIGLRLAYGFYFIVFVIRKAVALKKCQYESAKWRKKIFNIIGNPVSRIFIILILLSAPLITDLLLYRSFFYGALQKKGDLEFVPKVSIHSFNGDGKTFRLKKMKITDTSYTLQSNVYLTNEWKDILIDSHNALVFELITSAPGPVDTIRLHFKVQLQDSTQITPQGNWAIPYRATKELSISTSPKSQSEMNLIEEAIEHKESPHKFRYYVSHFPTNRKEEKAYNDISVKIE